MPTCETQNQFRWSSYGIEIDWILKKYIESNQNTLISLGPEKSLIKFKTTTGSANNPVIEKNTPRNSD